MLTKLATAYSSCCLHVDLVYKYKVDANLFWHGKTAKAIKILYQKI